MMNRSDDAVMSMYKAVKNGESVTPHVAEVFDCITDGVPAPQAAADKLEQLEGEGDTAARVTAAVMHRALQLVQMGLPEAMIAETADIGVEVAREQFASA